MSLDDMFCELSEHLIDDLCGIVLKYITSILCVDGIIIDARKFKMDRKNITRITLINDLIINTPLYFSNCTSLEYINGEQIVAIGDVSGMFSNCNRLKTVPHINMTNAVVLSNLFEEAYNFNQPLDWDTKNVVYMNSMFYKASSFNNDVSNWDISNVKTTRSMFYKAYNFSIKPTWNTDHIDDVSFMYYFTNIDRD